MARVKYMGSADVRLLPKGENWGGRLAEPLKQEVRFDWDNAHVVDTDKAGLSPEAVTLLLEDPNFKDVTDLKRIPAGLAQQLWRGVTDSTPNDAEPQATTSGATTGAAAAPATPTTAPSTPAASTGGDRPARS